MQTESIETAQLDEVTRLVDDLELRARDLELAAIPSSEGEPRGVWHRLEEFTPESIAGLVVTNDVHSKIPLSSNRFSSNR